MRKKIVILAAGKSKRIKMNLSKVLVPIAGKPMIEHLVKSVINSGVDSKPIIVVSADNENLINQALTGYSCQLVVQDKQLGTGHALACCKKYLDKKADYIICFYGDHPFIKNQTIKKLAASINGPITMMTVKLKDFNSWRKNFYCWGRIIRNNGQVKEIVEFKDAADEIKQIKEVNPGLYVFEASWLWQNIKKLDNKNAQKEYYLTDLIKMACQQNLVINSFSIEPKEAMGINSQEELAIAKKLLS